VINRTGKEFDMLKLRLLASVCALGLLAAGPAIAQNAGTTAPGTGTDQSTPGNAAGMNNAGSMGAGNQPTHAMNMHHHHGHMASNSRSPNAQDAEVARLNEESLQAAQQGHSFMAGSNGSGGMGGGQMGGGQMGGGQMGNGGSGSGAGMSAPGMGGNAPAPGGNH
jgi:hypothetical protein